MEGRSSAPTSEEILGHSIKCGGLSILDPRLLEEHAYNTSKAASEVLVGSLLGDNDLNYVEHKACAHKSITDGQKKREYSEIEALTRNKELINRAVLNRLRPATENRAWIIDITHRLNGKELSREELQDNILLQYGIVPLNLFTYCDGCGKRF